MGIVWVGLYHQVQTVLCVCLVLPIQALICFFLLQFDCPIDML